MVSAISVDSSQGKSMTSNWKLVSNAQIKTDHKQIQWVSKDHNNHQGLTKPKAQKEPKLKQSNM